MIEIQKNIPIPKSTAGNPYKKYNFEVMEIGDSFVVDISKISSVRVLACRFAKIKKSFKITARTIVEDGEKVLRVWRIK